MSALVFIRHGETDMAGKFCGHSNPDLNSGGKGQAAAAAEMVASLGIERICSSDLHRAWNTAKVVGHRIGVTPEPWPGLREMFFGEWEGLEWTYIEKKFPEESVRWLNEFPLRSAPGGEAYGTFTARIDSAIGSLLRDGENRRTAIVTHRGVMRYALTRFCAFPEAVAWRVTAPYGAVVVADCC